LDKFLQTVEGCENVMKFLFRKCIKLTPELAKIAKLVSASKHTSKVNSDSANALIRLYFPTEYSIVVKTGEQKSACKKM
jgi:hypothetical protein